MEVPLEKGDLGGSLMYLTPTEKRYMIFIVYVFGYYLLVAKSSAFYLLLILAQKSRCKAFTL